MRRPNWHRPSRDRCWTEAQRRSRAAASPHRAYPHAPVLHKHAAQHVHVASQPEDALLHVHHLRNEAATRGDGMQYRCLQCCEPSASAQQSKLYARISSRVLTPASQTDGAHLCLQLLMVQLLHRALQTAAVQTTGKLCDKLAGNARRRQGSPQRAATVPRPKATQQTHRLRSRMAQPKPTGTDMQLAAHLVIVVQVLDRQIEDGAPALLHNKRVTTASHRHRTVQRGLLGRKPHSNGSLNVAAEQQPAGKCADAITELQAATPRPLPGTAGGGRMAPAWWAACARRHAPECTAPPPGQAREGTGGRADESQGERASSSRQHPWPESAVS